MGKFIGKILVTALAALIAAHFIPGVSIKNGTSAVLLALVLAVLNAIVRPILIILTIPITVVTFGLFLLVINTIIIKWSALIVKGFNVVNWWSAFWFGILLSIVTFLIESLINRHAERD
ncbi:phage holin family protein [Danxiaibacter flavus]|uniref:Phage holin family protein n=1 Tax=Danxiaibacter flavus TaxID=3049108 RepID=A0ABV3ZM95_9BACT|nr:phage holin family protein [Chitinophagaceae bacterium DXS]